MKEAPPEFTNDLVLHINGGLGKCILATAVIKSYKISFPQSKIIVVSGYPEVYVNNPDIYKNFNFNVPYLWQDWYSKPGVKVYAQDPYLNPSWIKNHATHLVDVWCAELGVASVQKTPLLYFSGPELEELNAMVRVDKPLMVVQSTGGSNSAARSWTRNPPQHELEELLLKYKDSHYVLHLADSNTPVLQNIHQRVDTLNRRNAMCLVYYAQEFIGIDSYGLHTRAANTEAGPAQIFLPLADQVKRIGYPGKSMKYLLPRQEIQDMLKNHQSYYATVFKLSIEDVSENCPVPVGQRWFSF